MYNRILLIIGFFVAPIMVLNVCASIVGGIWLAFLGEWKLIGIGFLVAFSYYWILPILLIPGIPIAGIGTYFYKKKNPLGHLFSFISQVYTNILIIGTCVFAFLVCSSFYKGGSMFGLIPYLLWSWGMALGSWQFLASQEPDNVFSHITSFNASIFYLFFLTSVLISALLSFIMIIIFGVMQLIALPIFNVYIAYKMED